MTIAELKQLKESEDKVEFKEAKRNYPFNGGENSENGTLRLKIKLNSDFFKILRIFGLKSVLERLKRNKLTL